MKDIPSRLAADRYKAQDVDDAMGIHLTRDQALDALRDLFNDGSYDPEGAHGQAELILLRLISDREIAEAFYAFDFWYA